MLAPCCCCVPLLPPLPPLQWPVLLGRLMFAVAVVPVGLSFFVLSRCFASEYAILSIAAFSTAVHLLLHVVDNRMEGAWHAKATWVMLLEFFSEVGGGVCTW